MNSHTALRSERLTAGQGVGELSRLAVSDPSALVRVTPAGSSNNAAPESGGELGDAVHWVGVAECPLELGADDRVYVARLVAGGVADGLLGVRGPSNRRRRRSVHGSGGRGVDRRSG